MQIPSTKPDLIKREALSPLSASLWSPRCDNLSSSPCAHISAIFSPSTEQPTFVVVKFPLPHHLSLPLRPSSPLLLGYLVIVDNPESIFCKLESLMCWWSCYYVRTVLVDRMYFIVVEVNVQYYVYASYLKL